jgi:hypothetical protein
LSCATAKYANVGAPDPEADTTEQSADTRADTAKYKRRAHKYARYEARYARHRNFQYLALSGEYLRICSCIFHCCAMPCALGSEMLRATDSDMLRETGSERGAAPSPPPHPHHHHQRTEASKAASPVTMSTVLHRVDLPWKHPCRRIELVFQVTCPTGARLGAVRLWKVHTVTKRERRSLTQEYVKRDMYKRTCAY